VIWIYKVSKTFIKLEEGLKGVDVVMTLRIQKERMEEGQVPEGDEFFWSVGTYS
jgi:aspartate carbamoyltransferase catalytic subunit